MRSKLWLPVVFLLVLGLCVVETQGETLRVAWAEWAPADYLQELSKDFTKETGIKTIRTTKVFCPYGPIKETV